MIGLQLGVSRLRGGTSGCGQEEEVKYLQKGRRAGGFMAVRPDPRTHTYTQTQL